MRFVLIPGAWMGASIWEPVSKGLRELGHDVYPVTLPGVTKGADISTIRLSTDVDYVVSLLETEDLRDVIVVGHLWSGIVAGQVADRVPDRVAHSIFVEAFLPHDGQSMVDAYAYGDDEAKQATLREIAANGGWPPPTPQDVANEPDLTAEHQAWLVANFVMQPGHTVSDPAVLSRPLGAQRASYIACSNAGHWKSVDVAAMRDEPNWTFYSFESAHWPMVSAPDRLVALMDEIASRVG